MDVKTIEEVIKIVEESNFVEFDYKDEDVHLILKKKEAFVGDNIVTHTTAAPQTEVLSISAPAKEKQETQTEQTAEQDKSLIEIKSPMVATFYRAPSPTSPPYVEVGDEVKKGDVLCILEAMKIMNELEAEFPCKIEKILVENAEKVEYDQPLFLVKKLG